jgi:4-amino-4-deoxy-L-arabinose transferase-like glycosyltransferase
MLVVGIYLLTYRGLPISGDEIFSFDSTESLARRGNLYRTYEYNSIVLPQYGLEPGPDDEPWLEPIQEPMTIVLQVPIFWLGQSFDDIGTMHTVWLFNIFVTTLTVVSVYAVALMQGYRTGIAWLGALLYGVATIAWPYSRLLFREPVMTFFLLWAFAFALQIQKGWSQNRLPFWATAAFLLFVLGAFLTKAVTVIFVPGLLVLVLPPWRIVRRHQRWIIALGILFIIAAIAALLIINSDVVSRRYSLDSVVKEVDPGYILESILGYQVSPGRSIWLYSPILLLGFWGVRLLWKQEEWRLVLGLVLTILLVSIWYGLTLSVDWSGGWGWGPRYFVPLMPLMMFWVFPVLKQVYEKQSRTGMALVIGLAVLGAGMQVLGMSVRLSNYYTDLFFAGKLYDYDEFYADRERIVEEWRWLEGNWTIEWSPVYYHLDRFDLDHIDIAWRVADSSETTLALAFLLIGSSAGASIMLLRRGRLPSFLNAGYAVSSLVVLVLTLSVGLNGLIDDSRYIRDWPDVRQLIAELDAIAEDEEPVFIDREQYTELFMNYYKTPSLTVTLYYSPVERYEGNVFPLISEEITQLRWAGPLNIYALDWTADHYDSLWLVASSDRYRPPDSVRMIERYLAENYFPIVQNNIAQSELAVESDDGSRITRAIQFLTVDVPDGEPSISLNYNFSDELLLGGVDLPGGNQYEAGGVVPVSLAWQPFDNVSRDYTAALFLLDENGMVVAQYDSIPQYGFGLTSQWVPGEVYRDNYGFRLPENLPPGDYSLQTVVYYWDADAQMARRLPVSDADGQLLGDIVELSNLQIRP